MALPKPQLVWFLKQQRKKRQEPVPLAQGVTFKPNEG
ncbi:hypothetical protein PFOEGONH_00065 [Klebsiella phage vB_KppS-Pokey]|nr:hypothetical protein LCALLHIG_00063 [Klebsiella phage vB_KppS-Raw]CAD5235884.1 hypothetical protein PFOEGONH_00065 [Klebsiella phage vB_KppS-Pokey]CAD5235933.1 hypothetical protein OPBIHMGG_00054 [Klebsiella phage vB_KppS-Eggy]